jgi:hypothetical protein
MTFEYEAAYPFEVAVFVLCLANPSIAAAAWESWHRMTERTFDFLSRTAAHHLHGIRVEFRCVL